MNQNIFEKTMVCMTWPQIEQFVKKDALVLLPIGVIEEHGKHLPLGTDIYLATWQANGLANAMEQENFPCIIAPPYYWGTMEIVTKNFPGSFTAAPEHIQNILNDILLSLERAGFSRVLTTNFHGDALHIRTVMKLFKAYNEAHKLNARFLVFEDEAKNYGLTGKENFLLTVPPYPLEQRVQGLSQLTDLFDVHAGAIETACMMEAFPELVDLEMAKQQKPTDLKDEKIAQWMSGCEEYNKLTPAGHVGDPAKTTLLTATMAKVNQTLAHQIVQRYSKTTQD